ADNIAFTNPLVQSMVTESSYQVTELQPETTYYWKVMAVNGNGIMPSEDIFSFTTPPASEAKAAARYLGQYAIGINERKGASDWPGHINHTPQGWGKIWQSGTAKWNVHFPKS